jgi:hypothetical protein
MAFEKFDHLGHALKRPPTAGAGEYFLQLYAESKLRITWPMRQDLRDKLLITVATPIREWLDTLPDGAKVSGGQILEVFCGSEKADVPDFRIAFLKFLYSCRRFKYFDGYFEANGRNKWGQPYINYHKKDFTWKSNS